ncbi:hypothetical protein MRB53_013187 [Persea americana]|uniref:Uncharacterized protein n=1 Tax=Persea americana TaxID=3435 RepID=A0ACC2K7M2_PERAE|nr:hypothetical protein MRB53_013187 [Persea americana]
MTTSGSSSSLSRCTRRSRSFEYADENGDRKVKELEKSKSFPAISRTKPTTFNFWAKIEEFKKWMLQWTILYATFQLKCTVELKNDDATTQEVNEDSSDKRQPVGQQLQPPKNAQADLHLTNERTSNGTEDTSPIDSTHAHDEDGFGVRQPLRQQQNLQNTHRTLALTYERTSDTTNYRSPLDHRIRIGDEQLPVQGQTSQINIGDQQQPGQTSQINIGDQRLSVREQPSMQGQTSHNAIRTSNGDYNLPYRYMPAVIGAVIFLLGLLYLFRVIG